MSRAKIQERAEKLARQGKIPAAVAEYRLLLKEQPNDIATLNRIGDMLARSGGQREAIETFERVAHLYTLGGFFDKAIAIYKKILKIDTGAVDARLRLADLYARRDLVTEARSEYTSIAQELVEKAQDSKAREVYDKLVRLDPGNLSVRTLLADLYEGTGDGARAIGELQGVARDLEALGLQDDARAVHRRILGAEGAAVDARADSACYLARGGEGELALASIDALRDKYPEEPALSEAAVVVYEFTGNPEAAERLVRDELGGTASRPFARAVLARMRDREGHRSEAITLLLESVRQLKEAGRLADAARIADLLLEMDPEHRAGLEIRLELARALDDFETSGRISDSLAGDIGEQAGESVAHESTGPEPPAPEPGIEGVVGLGRPLTREERDFLSEHLTEAEVFGKYGLHEKAIEPLQLVLSRFPSHLEAHIRLKGIFADRGNRSRVVAESLVIADLFERLGRREDAIRALTEGKNLDPENAVIKGKLERLQGTTRRVAQPPREAARAHPAQDFDIEVQEEAPMPVPTSAPAPSRGNGHDEPAGLVEAGGDMTHTLEQILDQESHEAAPAPESQGLGDVLAEFRQRVSEEIGIGDFRTHYDLGIAYKEMGLVEDAIAELELASGGPDCFLDCCAMLGLCYRQLGRPESAVEWYRKGIAAGAGDEAGQLGLQFELAEAYVEMGDVGRARETFLAVAGVDRNYRDVTTRLREVEGLD